MSQNDFFQSGRYQSISLAGGELLLIKEAFSSPESAELFIQLRKHIAWSQDEIYVAGRRVLIPRLQAWYGDAAYRYSGLTMKPLAWTPLLRRIKQSVDAFSNCQFNSVLLNLYRDGNDSMGWHSDDEPELGCNPVIASLSLGASRAFSLQQKKPGSDKLKLQLNSGDLLIMSGALQHNWRHQLPKTRLAVGERINLTFRSVVA